MIIKKMKVTVVENIKILKRMRLLMIFHNENKKLKEEHKEFTYKSNKNIKHNNTHSNIKNRKNYTNEDKLDVYRSSILSNRISNLKIRKK